jgi:hypothetical protein
VMFGGLLTGIWPQKIGFHSFANGSDLLSLAAGFVL